MVLWQELDLHQLSEIKNHEVGKHLAKILEHNQVFEFLAGLNSDFDEVSGRILRKEPLCSLEESFSIFSALQTAGFSPTDVGQLKNPNRNGETDSRWCDFGNRPQHARQTCWKLKRETLSWRHGKSLNAEESVFNSD
ncbi:hypothetical protein JRO89_XS06G0072800 [Xanthoceras sorbifolium]|uniref:Uncharacterized protein n=1 Tax=Xanthoceras sorbifolium TaxID=99658 RepID=A0ABQ8HX36_9ROSI|nr:hypothetical protein JRO89_XS06G0072800 [Xanthoceras sorbifolium]